MELFTAGGTQKFSCFIDTGGRQFDQKHADVDDRPDRQNRQRQFEHLLGFQVRQYAEDGDDSDGQSGVVLNKVGYAVSQRSAIHFIGALKERCVAAVSGFPAKSAIR
jgi:hypothetical protein